MGARAHMSPRLLQILPEHLEFGYIGRPERASPGEGYPAAHTVEQNRIIRTALDLATARSRSTRRRRRASAERGAAARGRLRPRRHAARHHGPRGRDARRALRGASTRSCPGVEFDHLRERFRDGRDHLYERVLSGELDIPTYRRLHLIAVCEPWGEPSEAMQATAARLRDEQLGRSRFVEHAIELLRSLREAGVRTGLLTNGPSWMQRRKVELLGLEAQLDAIGISEELGASKPDPAAFTATLELMGSAPDDTVMVGDHLDWDVRGALAAGMRGAVWVAGDEDERHPPPGAMKVARLGEVPAALAALA